MVYHQKDSLGQNFIKYPQLVAELLEVSGLKREDKVVEIGPGKGIITKQLARRVTQVIAVEKDEVLADELRDRIAEEGKVKVVCQDFLDFPLPETAYKIVANIPFSATARIINKVLEAGRLPESMHLIMQKEAAEKYVGVSERTQSSVMVGPWFEVEILGEIDRTNFTEKPQVVIVYTAFRKREQAFIKEEDKNDFRNFVIYGFNQWQPTFVEAMKGLMTYEQLKGIKKSFKLGGLKPGEVSFDNWLAVFKTFKRLMNEEQKLKLEKYREHYLTKGQL